MCKHISPGCTILNWQCNNKTWLQYHHSIRLIYTINLQLMICHINSLLCTPSLIQCILPCPCGNNLYKISPTSHNIIRAEIITSAVLVVNINTSNNSNNTDLLPTNTDGHMVAVIILAWPVGPGQLVTEMMQHSRTKWEGAQTIVADGEGWR
eukprot:5192148-Ditylum_brightwellii.AAC.1